MVEMILSLLNNDNNMYDDFCKIFFKEYDKNHDDYISKEELKEPLEEIIKQFPIDNMGQHKLMSVYKILDKSNDTKTKKLIEQLYSDNINNITNNIIKILKEKEKEKNDTQITFDEFKEIVRLLLYCLIDHGAKNSESTTDEDDYNADTLENEGENENIFALNSHTVNYDGFIEMLINDIMENYCSNLNDLKYSIIKVLNNISINDINMDITIEDINILFKYNNINKNTNKKQIIKLLKIFINDLF
jgi:hypothetical protein